MIIFLLNGVGLRLRPLSLGPDSIAAWILPEVLLGGFGLRREMLWMVSHLWDH